MYKELITIFLLIIIVSCTSKNGDSSASNGFAKDTFRIEAKTYLKEYAVDSTVKITEQKKVNFEKGKTSDNQEILIQTTLHVTKNSGWYPQYQLNIKAFISINAKFDKLLWQIDKSKQEPDGIWNEFYKTVEHGCCDAENGYSLYDLRNGKEVLTFSEITNLPLNYDFIAYQSVSTVNFERGTDSTIIGKIKHLHNSTGNLTNYLVHSKAPVGYEGAAIIVLTPTEYTPHISVESKSDLSATGFFKSFPLYQQGELIQKLDTSNYYLVLKYYDITNTILLPVDENGIKSKELISSSKILSTFLQVERD
jgi:hypothetical protein